MKYILLIILLLPFSAAAETPKIDMTTILLQDNGQPMRDPSGKAEDDKDCAKCPPLTLGHAIALTLNVPEQHLTVEQLFGRGGLIKRVKDNSEATLSAEDVTTIEHAMANATLSPSMVFQIIPMIDPNFKGR